MVKLARHVFTGEKVAVKVSKGLFTDFTRGRREGGGVYVSKQEEVPWYPLETVPWTPVKN